jgi:hypothetical protein
MISIVICSRDTNVLAKVQENVALTIGVPHEVIAIDNSKGRYGICEAYNLGAAQANFELLCFMHEDISFETKLWGEKIRDAFANSPKLGLLGVAGSSYKPAMPSGWSYPYAGVKTTYMNIVQCFKDGREEVHIYNNPHNKSLSKVVSVDGVWFCTRKSIVKQIPFDEKAFTGFHCYDVDFSLSVYQQYEVAITYDILLKHFSEGSFDDKWATETIKLHEKWKKYLPINLEGISSEEKHTQEFGAFHYILPKVLKHKEALAKMLKYVLSVDALSLLGIKKFATVVLLLIKKLYVEKQ